MNSHWSHSPETVKLGVDLCDLDLWPLTFTFCMDVTFVIGNNSWKCHDDTMMGTWWKRCDGRTDGQTDRQTDGLNQSYSCLVAAKNIYDRAVRMRNFSKEIRKFETVLMKLLLGKYLGLGQHSTSRGQIYYQKLIESVACISHHIHRFVLDVIIITLPL